MNELSGCSWGWGGHRREESAKGLGALLKAMAAQRRGEGGGHGEVR
jgi:hypothetical protein